MSFSSVLLCQNPCPIIPEPQSYYARTLVLLCQNPCPIMPEPLSYYARTPVLLCPNPCPIMAEPLSYYARTPVLLCQNPCVIIPETVSVYPKAPEVPKKYFIFFQEILSYFAKNRVRLPSVQKPYHFPHKIKPIFCSRTIFYHPSVGTSPPFQNLVGIFPFLLLGANQPALEGGVNARKNLRPFSCSFTLLRATWEEGK